ncbi:MAG: hypothetical protein KAR45_15565 [Desulfobacteraceae bacterium]|nr:hypothetical protein [Desulfobacteraceae bacterium]
MAETLKKIFNSTSRFTGQLEPFDLSFSDPNQNKFLYGSSSGWSRPFGKGGRILIWQTDGNEKTVPVAYYSYKKGGWMNRWESAVLAFKSDSITFTRIKNSGCWKYNDEAIGTIELSSKMRLFRLGNAQISYKGTNFGNASLPVVGPGNTGKKDCTADLTLHNSTKIALLLDSKFIKTSMKEKVIEINPSSTNFV